jgi:hypothetical protein
MPLWSWKDKGDLKALRKRRSDPKDSRYCTWRVIDSRSALTSIVSTSRGMSMSCALCALGSVLRFTLRLDNTMTVQQ